MGSEIVVLMLPGAILLAFFLPLGIKKTKVIFSERKGPYVSTEALDQITLLFLLYIVLFLVPVAGRLVGGWGHVASLGTLFAVCVSLVMKFKEIGDD